MELDSILKRIILTGIAITTFSGFVYGTEAQKLRTKTKSGEDTTVVYKFNNNRRINPDGSKTLIHSNQNKISIGNNIQVGDIVVEYNQDGSTTKGRIISPGDNRYNIDEKVKEPTPTDDDQLIHVMVRGYSDKKNDGKQQDRKEALLDAYIQAIEQGTGINISSITKVKNYMLIEDIITSEAAGILMPGYKIVDIGYKDGVYEIVLSGFVRICQKDKKFELANQEFEKGVADYDNKDYGFAATHFEDAIRLNSFNSDYHNKLGDAWIKLSEPEKALKSYENCVRLNPKDGNAWAGIGYIYCIKDYENKSRQKAYDAFQKGAELGDPHCIESLKIFDKICEANNLL